MLLQVVGRAQCLPDAVAGLVHGSRQHLCYVLCAQLRQRSTLWGSGELSAMEGHVGLHRTCTPPGGHHMSYVTPPTGQ